LTGYYVACDLRIDRRDNLKAEPGPKLRASVTRVPQHGACYGERIELVFGTMHPRHRQPTRTELQLLKNENDGLRTEIVRLRRELENRQGAVGRLELLLRERLTKIDELTGQVDQLRHQNMKRPSIGRNWWRRAARQKSSSKVTLSFGPLGPNNQSIMGF
jgi:hypothetical protein